MKKKLGMLLFAAVLFGATSASASATTTDTSTLGVNCVWLGTAWACDY
ncbi:hypothetical protein [Viridibacillus arvi]|nr:hypothetical protein [Viridibacillus sp. JNUCC-6]QOV11266.1 hypothetical protein JNUCC6_00235 [Viridibacillus sp. JNUCC-6]